MRLIGVEAGGEGIAPGRHAARFAGGSPGVLQGTWTYVLQDAAGNIELTHSVSAGLDYAAVGPEHAWLREQGRVSYRYATDDARRSRRSHGWRGSEGILPALESAHAIAARARRRRASSAATASSSSTCRAAATRTCTWSGSLVPAARQAVRA